MKEARPTPEEFFGDLRLDKIAKNALDIEKAGEMLCDFVDISEYRCQDCPFFKICKVGETGAVVYLKQLKRDLEEGEEE